jgi:hypothetical protein
MAARMASATIPAAKIAALFTVTSWTDRRLYVSVKPTRKVKKWWQEPFLQKITFPIAESWRAGG